MLFTFLAGGLTWMQISENNFIPLMIWNLYWTQAALVDWHDNVLWPEVGIESHDFYTQTLHGLSSAGLHLELHNPREVSSSFPQRVYTWLPAVWNWVGETVWDLGIQETFLRCSCLIYTLPSCLGSVSLRPFILLSFRRLTLQTSAGAARDICPGACKRKRGHWEVTAPQTTLH